MKKPKELFSLGDRVFCEELYEIPTKKRFVQITYKSIFKGLPADSNYILNPTGQSLYGIVAGCRNVIVEDYKRHAGYYGEDGPEPAYASGIYGKMYLIATSLYGRLFYAKAEKMQKLALTWKF